MDFFWGEKKRDSRFTKGDRRKGGRIFSKWKCANLELGKWQSSFIPSFHFPCSLAFARARFDEQRETWNLGDRGIDIAEVFMDFREKIFYADATVSLNNEQVSDTVTWLLYICDGHDYFCNNSWDLRDLSFRKLSSSKSRWIFWF